MDLNDSNYYINENDEIKNKFQHSIASLGDLYRFNETNQQDHNNYIENFNQQGILDPNRLKVYEKRIANQYNPRDSKERALQQNHNIKAFTPGEQPSVLEVTYLKPAIIPESRKYSHVKAGVINPPPRHYSIKPYAEQRFEEREKEAMKLRVNSSRVRVEHNVCNHQRVLEPGHNQHNSGSWEHNQNHNQNEITIGTGYNAHSNNSYNKKNTSKSKSKPKNRNNKASTRDYVSPREYNRTSHERRQIIQNGEELYLSTKLFLDRIDNKLPQEIKFDKLLNDVDKIENSLNHLRTSSKKYDEEVKRKQNKLKKTSAEKYIKKNPNIIFADVDPDERKKIEEKLELLHIELRGVLDSLTKSDKIDEKIDFLIKKAKKLKEILTYFQEKYGISSQSSIKNSTQAKFDNKDIMKSIDLNKITNQEKEIIKEEEEEKEDYFKINENKIDNRSFKRLNTYASGENIDKVQLRMSNILKESNGNFNVFKENMNNSNQNIDNSKNIPKQILIVDKKPENSLNESTSLNFNFSQQNLRTSNIFSDKNYSSLKQINKDAEQQHDQRLDTSIVNYQTNEKFFKTNNEKNEKPPNKEQKQNNSIETSSLNISLSHNKPRFVEKIEMDTKNFTQDGRFSAYDVKLPVDYYYNITKQNEPVADKEWYVRPHHIESVTKSGKAVNDDLLNTKYVSYYSPSGIDFNSLNNPYPNLIKKKEEMMDEVIEGLENKVDKLKNELNSKKIKKFEKFENQYKEIKKSINSEMDPNKLLEKIKMEQNIKKTEDLIKNSKTYSEMFSQNDNVRATNVIINSYETLLNDLRKQEKEILNAKRQKELERIRPPVENWWQLKGKEFQKEFQRNKMILKAGNKYFEKLKDLQDNTLY